MTDRKTEKPDDGFETIAPAEVVLTREDPQEAPSPLVRRRLLTWAGVVVLGLLVGGLIAVLPSALRPDLESIAAGSEEPPASARERDRSSGPAQRAREEEDEGEPVAPYQQSRLERERRAVEDLITRLLDLQDELEAKAVEQWGVEELASAQMLADAGDEAFLEEQFDTARDRYESAVESLETLRGQAQGAYEDALARGGQAIEDGEATRAREAYTLAAAIRPDSGSAQSGLARAQVLDEVLAKLREAEGRMGSGELEAAKADIEAALALDPDTTRAQQALTEVRAAIRARDFNTALSRGYAALADNRLDAARSAFRDALNLRSDASEAREGLQLVEQASTDRRIDDLRREAERLLAAEKWSQAAERYAEALELDSPLSFARRGRSEALRLADLDERLQETLEHPDRLSEDVVLARARELLDQGRAVPDPAPGFAARVNELDELLQIAAEPVTVRLRSDGATEVTILRVARLGSFEERSIELRPGLYTATGSRPGFRDVRLEFRVAADGSGNPVVIRTEERI